MKRFGWLLVCSVIARTALAGEIEGAVGAVGEATEWNGDSAAYASLRIGYRWRQRLSVEGAGWFGHGAVDDRVLSYYTLGAAGWIHVRSTREYLRLGLVHQHEEPVASVRNDPLGAAFGVGDGIRHRGGFQGALGLEWPFKQFRRTELAIGIETSATWFPDPRGPSWYAGGGVSIAINHSL